MSIWGHITCGRSARLARAGSAACVGPRQDSALGAAESVRRWLGAGLLVIGTSAGIGLSQPAWATKAALAPGSTEAEVAALAEGRTEAAPKELEGVGVDPKLGHRLPPDLSFTKSDGSTILLKELFASERPVLLTLNYSDCPMLCNLQLEGFVEGLHGVGLSLGEGYDVITVSIDPKEPTERAARTKARYVKAYGRDAKTAASGWHFLTGSEQSIKALADAVGFRYRYLPDTQEYAHAAAVMVISPQRKITRYLYGVAYEPQTINLSLVEASEGTVGTPLDQILLYCFHYDATKGRYAPAAFNLMRLGCAITVLILAGFLVRKKLHTKSV